MPVDAGVLSARFEEDRPAVQCQKETVEMATVNVRSSANAKVGGLSRILFLSVRSSKFEVSYYRMNLSIYHLKTL